ncbi:MAG: rRNA maturation RNase YbeY [Acidobacteriota bacterium]
MAKLIEHYSIESAEITLAFVPNREIKKLNRRFLQKDNPTDVLSFPVGEKAADGLYYLGDIIISPQIAFCNCRRKPHGLERELEILTIHGFLHLLGYEHDRDLEEEEEQIRKLLLKDYNEH